MTRRTRDRGPRRRGPNANLVRPMPSVNTPPPPIPLDGRIHRAMTPALISDYEGLSTASWSTGVTGAIGTGGAGSSWNCWYHHVVQSDPRVEYSVIMQPVRWSIAAPSADGGTYDFWNTRSGGLPGYIPQGLGGSDGSGNFGGTLGIVNKLLPTGHFAEYPSGFAELYTTLVASPCRLRQGFTNTWTEAALQAISPTTQISGSGPQITVAAIRHRVNGTAVGTLQLNPPGNRSVTNAWRFDLVEGDTYAIDIWYRFRILPEQFATWQTRACAYIPTTLVSNGSRRYLPTLASLPVATFRNVNFSPAFNFKEQTYQVTVSGHTGWTLKDGSDGPHKMVTAGNWSAGIGNGQIVWRYNPQNSYCNAIVFRWDREYPTLEFYPGPSHSMWAGSRGSTPPLIFRPAAAGYRTNTTSTDFSTLGHIDAGTFTQSGTTTFNLVQLITDAVPAFLSDGTILEPSYPEAFDFGAGVGILNPDIPTTITLTRVSQ